MSDSLYIDLAVRYLHFLAIFAMFSLLAIEHLLLKNTFDGSWLKRIAIVNMAFSISALIALLAGLALWFWVGKPAGFYHDNGLFNIKIGLFVVTGALSFVPSRYITQQCKVMPKNVAVPRYIVHIIRLELAFLCIIPLLAVLMANGVGYTI